MRKGGNVRKLLIISGILALTGCTHLKEDTSSVVAAGVGAEADAVQVLDNEQKNAKTGLDLMKENAMKTGEYMRKWFIMPKPDAPRDDRVIASSYCYRVLQDIVCYRQPMPGWEHRLVAYQGTHAKEPPLAMMEPLPKRAEDVAAAASPPQKAESKVANVKPVFKDLPKEQKPAEEEQPDLGPVPETVHEQLPNPALAPQL